LSAAVAQLKLTNATSTVCARDVSAQGRAAGGGRGDDDALRQRHILGQTTPASAAAGRTVPGPTRLELDAQRQPDGGGLGHRDLRPLIERHGDGRHIVSTASIAGLISGNSIAYTYQVRRRRAVEGLRLELAPAASVCRCSAPLHPHRITSSGRNLPQRFAGAFRGPPPTTVRWPSDPRIRERVAHGIYPAYVGELVRGGIENDWPYIFTDTGVRADRRMRSPPSGKALTASARANRNVERTSSESFRLIRITLIFETHR